MMKHLLTTTTLLLATGLAGNAAAHTQSGSLGTAAGSVDLYEVSCGTGSAVLKTRIRDYLPKIAAVVSVQTTKGNIATNSADPIDGDTLYSPQASTAGGEGFYTVSVSKTGAGAEAYLLEFHCMSSGGAHTETAITSLQNK